jgi:hypothetical protein
MCGARSIDGPGDALTISSTSLRNMMFTKLRDMPS